MNYQLALTLVQRPEVLERVLRVVRHRGFTITNMNMQLQGDRVSIEMKLESERSLALLTNQLDKLIDVIECHQLSACQSAVA